MFLIMRQGAFRHCLNVSLLIVVCNGVFRLQISVFRAQLIEIGSWYSETANNRTPAANNKTGSQCTLTPPKYSPKIFAKILLVNPLFKSVCCVPPYKLPPVMRIPMPNPIGGGEHFIFLLFWRCCAMRCAGAPRTPEPTTRVCG